MISQEEQQRIMMTFVTARSSAEAQAVVERYPMLNDPRAVALLERMIAAAYNAGRMNAFQDLSAARERLLKIQSEA
jgi:hypothetical protein